MLRAARAGLHFTLQNLRRHIMKMKADDYLVYDAGTGTYKEDAEQLVRDDVEKHYWLNVARTIAKDWRLYLMLVPMILIFLFWRYFPMYELLGCFKVPMAKQFEDPQLKNVFRNAPAVIFIAHKPGPCTQVDCGLMAGNMVLSAKSLGLGSIVMMGPLGFFSTEAGAPFLQSLGLSEGYKLLLCVGVGYADEEPAARPRNKEVVKYVE